LITRVLTTKQEKYNLPCSPKPRDGDTNDSDDNDDDGYASPPICVFVCACARTDFGNAGAQNQTLSFEMEKALLAAGSGKFSFICLCPKLT
jgi:hypothetical protein